MLLRKTVPPAGTTEPQVLMAPAVKAVNTTPAMLSRLAAAEAREPRPVQPPVREVTGKAALTRRAAAAHSEEVQRARRNALRRRVHAKLIEEMNHFGGMPDTAVEQRIRGLVNEIVLEQHLVLNREERERVAVMVQHDVLGLGPLEELLADPSITEIMVNGRDRIWVERNGRLQRAALTFESDTQLSQVIDRIVRRMGRRIDETSSMVDARLADGSRVNVVVPPLSLTGPTITIRRFGADVLRMQQFIEQGTLDEQMVCFLAACVRARLNILVTGGSGSGKTTLLNLLSAFCGDDERIVTIEDAAELQLRQRHTVPLESRPMNIEGRGLVTIRDLVINALRMRPDRIIIGEVRGGEALDMLQAMNTGHDGSLSTVHANSPKDALARLQTLVLMAGHELPSRAIREQIAAAVQIVVHVAKLRDGSRRITSISEVIGMHDGAVQLHELFRFHSNGLGQDGRVSGAHTATGIVPRNLERILLENGGRMPALSELNDEPVNWAAIDVAEEEEEIVGTSQAMFHELGLLPGEELLLGEDLMETMPIAG